ncbi:MAG TPA: DNA polymerase I, partial [Candidatus Pygmaiobacter gallistercoris]|nr:DNA polymerase I [Candidatus Pygmaiobacter gallistercoris]
AAGCAKAGDECVIATGDRDSLQLVSPTTRVLLASTRMGRSVTINMDEAAVREKYGVEPRQLIEVKALMGDASDNIPGVGGVGEKTALALISEFGSLAGVYENLDSDKIKPAVRAKLERDKEQAEMSRYLAEIVTDAPIDASAADYRRTEGHPAAAARLLASLEMYGLLEKLGLQEADTLAAPEEETAQLNEVGEQPLPAALSGRVAIGLRSDGGYSVVQGDRLYRAAPEDPAFLALLTDAAVEKRAFDTKPLYALAARQGERAKGIVFDGKLAAYLLNPAAGSYDPVRLAAEYKVAPAFSASDPAAGLLDPLFDALAAAVEAQGMTRLLVEIEQPLAEVLASMELTGVQLDTDGVRRFGEELRAALTAELDEIYRLVGYEFNLNSTRQLGDALFSKLGLPAKKKTKSGWSTNAETLESLRGVHPVIDHILLYRSYQKLNSTYVEGLLRVVGEDGRVHSVFNQTETRTGRISSSEPNLQNIPVRTELGSRLRRYFIAPQGSVLLDADYSQIELRILAAISGDKNMQKAFADGEDIHRATASRIFGVPFEMVTPQLRSRAKAVNFGIVYGIGAFSLSKDVGVSVAEADSFIKSYLNEYSGVREYMERTVKEGHEQGYVTTLYGRRRPLPEINAANRNVRALGERMAMNTPIQGTAADIIKLAMIRVFRRLADEGLRAKLVLQVHDELIVEAPAAEAQRAAAILGEEMERAADLPVRLIAEVQEGATWYDAKD